MKKLIFFLALIGGLIFPVLAFAEINFSSPTGEVWFPITFSATWEAGDIPENAVWVDLAFQTDFTGHPCEDFGNLSQETSVMDPPLWFPASGLSAEWVLPISDTFGSNDAIDCAKKNLSPAIITLYFWDENFVAILDGYFDHWFVLSGPDIQAPYNIIPLQLDFPAKILTYPKTLFSDIGDIIALIIGLPLAFWGIGKVITLAKF